MTDNTGVSDDQRFLPDPWRLERAAAVSAGGQPLTGTSAAVATAVADGVPAAAALAVAAPAADPTAAAGDAAARSATAAAGGRRRRGTQAGAGSRRSADLPYYLVLAAGVASVAWVWHGGTQRARGGTLALGGALVVAALARLVLPEGRAGMLASRGRFIDVVTLAALAVGLLVAGLMLPTPS